MAMPSPGSVAMPSPRPRIHASMSRRQEHWLRTGSTSAASLRHRPRTAPALPSLFRGWRLASTSGRLLRPPCQVLELPIAAANGEQSSAWGVDGELTPPAIPGQELDVQPTHHLSL